MSAEENSVNDLFQEIPVEQREGMLRDNAYKSELAVVSRPYSPEHITQFKEELSESSVNLSQQISELEKVKKEFEARIKPLKLEIKEAVTKLRNKFEESEEMVYLLDDQMEGVVKIFDARGVFLYSRKLFPSEKQTQIFNLQERKQA